MRRYARLICVALGITVALVNNALLHALAASFSLGRTEVMDTLPRAPAGQSVLILIVIFNMSVLATALQGLAPPRWRTTSARQVMLAFLCALAALGILEGEARRAVCDHPTLFRVDPDLGVDLNPGFDGRLEQAYYVRINDQGARGDALPPADGRRPLTVLVLGDSAPFGSGVDQEDVFTARLQASLATRYPARQVRVINAARPGTLTNVGLWLLQHHWGAWRPDVAVVAYNNDSLRTEVSALPAPGPLRFVKHVLYRLAAYRLLVQVATHENLVRGPLPLYGGAPGARTPARVNFERNLAEIVRLQKSWNGEAVFVSMPRYAPRADLAHFESLSTDFRACARRLMQREGGHYLELCGSGDFPEADPAMFKRAIPDEVHPSAAGHAILAHRVEQFLVDHVLGAQHH